MVWEKLTRDFYNRDTVDVAQSLLGHYLIHRVGDEERVGKIVEVEAYLGQRDLAAHSSRGITPRTRVMFGPPGYAYVYLIYGMYHCVNVVTEPEGQGTAVLLRALEPIQNLASRTEGPGLLCRAMGIDRQLNAHDLLSDNFFVAKNPAVESFSIIRTPRIGVDYAKEWAKEELRFYIKDNPFVSRRK
ncbi:3-methyladenine DNA glycosylase [Legionella rubrilucens]|uniref:Putative 3-methyladenine DNA glycosylase n=1 Tax=Legionella rubrilucens TaxID=458 RepID=A0A0W0XQW6_9GAMM|nr:DNA-3-methyladenine glycosylase [Legionella rubrilucens]KTD47004.1 3-methyladenine DNA glycosylase [Legionella rubrilucens]